MTRSVHWLEGPLLFLDIDGVLNSHAFACRTDAKGILGIDPEAVKHLQRIVDETGCSIVLSSTWRKLHSLADMRGKLIEAGMTHPVPLRDKTPDLNGKPRGLEINSWLDTAGYNGRYVCLDDDSDFLPGQPLVQTSFSDGLTPEHADRCIAILRGSPAPRPGEPHG